MIALRLPEQRRDHGDSVDPGRRGDSGQFRRGGQEIPERPHLVAGRAGFDFSRPARHGGLPDAAFVEIALDAAQRPAAVEEFRIVPAFLMRPVVAGEDDQRVLVLAGLFQLRHDAADVAIETRHHGREILLHLRPRLTGERLVAGHFHAVADVPAQFIVGMRRSEGQVEEERILLLAVQELQRALGEQILHPLLPLAQILLDDLLFLVVPETLRIVSVGVSLIQKSEPVVESL